MLCILAEHHALDLQREAKSFPEGVDKQGGPHGK